MTLLNMSIYGAVIILAILIIRAFTLHKLPKKTFLILWAVALVRLLVPFEIASGFSLYSLFPKKLTPQETQTSGTPNTENPYAPFENYYDYLAHKQQVSSGQDDTIIVGEDGGLIYLPTDPPDGEIVPLPDANEESLPITGNTAIEPEQPDSSLTIQELWNNLRPHLPLFWGIGALLCAGFFLISYIRCRLEFSTSLPVTEAYAADWLKQHPLKRTVSIRQSDKISAPLTYSTFRPVILMPKKTDWNNTEQLDYVLYHEFTHIRRFDLLAKLVTIAAVCLHWFNPFVWLLYFFFNRDLELSCDDCVVKHFGEAKSAYAGTLIGMEEKKNFSAPLCNHFSKNAIEERITAIMKSKKTTIGMMVAAIVIVILVVVTLTTGRKDEEAASDLTPTPSENSDSSVMTEYEEILTPRIQEYLTMMNSCFLNNPPIAGEATPENAVSIAGNTGFYPVDEEVFPSYDALIGYVKGICTEKYTDELCRRYWLLDLNILPNIGVLSGKAYTKLFQSTTYPEHFEITDIKENIKPYDDTTLSATIRFTEGTTPYYWGVLTFAKQEDTWYVADVTLHRHPMDVSPTPTMWPVDDSPSELPPADNEFYYPETNYTYSNKDSLVRFDHSGSTLSPKDGYDFTISSFVSTTGKNVLTNLTINLEDYAGNTTWWCMAAFYDEDNVYLEFVPAASVEDAPSGILHVTIPVKNPDAYTVHPAGDFHAQKASAFWFNDICKIRDKIYFNNGSCDGSLWVYDITTGEMTDLSYVNEKMQELANELCADFGWSHDPAIWFNVGCHSYDGIITYEANVCKEMDLGTFFILRVHYKDSQFLDYSYAYKGAQEEPYTQEELNTQLQELFFRYQEMQEEFFYTNLKVASPLFSENTITINGTGGYTRVTDERFPTLKSVFEYMETICTPQFAKYLRDNNWRLSTTKPVVAEHNGVLYTQTYDAVIHKGSYLFSPIVISEPNTCILSYEAYIGIPSNKTESGTVYFKYTDGGWHVSNHSYTYYHNFVDGLDMQIMADLFSKYRTMHAGLFLTELECTSHRPFEEIALNGTYYYRVLDEDFPSLQSVIDYMETICTPDFAEELRKKHLNMNTAQPYLAEIDGILYTQGYHSSTNGYSQEFKFTDLQYDGSGTATVTYQTGGTIYPNIVEIGTITFRVMERGGWRIADLDYSYKNIATEGIFEDAPGSLPTTMGPDWYNAVDELMHGNTPKNTVSLSPDTVVPDYVVSALKAQASSYLAQCGLGSVHRTACYAVCETNDYTVYAADISYAKDTPTYFTVYHAYDGSELAGKVIFRHQIPFYDTINDSHVNAMYINMDDVVTMAKEQFEAFYESKSYAQPYKITSIHMTSFESIEVEFLLSESGNFDIYTEAEVKFTYDFQKELWYVSSFRETPPDYLTSFGEFPELTAEDVVVTGKDWCLTFLDESELPRFKELMDAGGELSSELIDSRFPEEGSHYIITLDGIGYYFYSNSAPENNHSAWNIYILSPDHPLSGGAKVGMTEQELLALYPDLAKTTLSGDDPAFNGTYGSDWFAFRNDQFPESFLKEYDYAYTAYLDKEREGLPVCIAFLMTNGQVGTITVYMPTAD